VWGQKRLIYFFIKVGLHVTAFEVGDGRIPRELALNHAAWPFATASLHVIVPAVRANQHFAAHTPQP
jgi:hypothetical protein